MLEQGIIQLVQTGLNDATIIGGFITQLPTNAISPATPKAWTYRTIIANPGYILNGQDPVTDQEVQIDCHGMTVTDAITLARDISNILSGYVGTLPEGTRVQGIFRLPSCVDGFSDANRSFVRSLEFSIRYIAS